MSTIASPRPTEHIQSPSSSRSSLSLDRQSIPGTGPRRHRAALRDYYGLKSAAPANGTVSNGVDELVPQSELDKPDFDPASYVSKIFARDGLEGVLKVEAGLMGEIRGLDGERKALVYDNYSKLIAATDTIRRMRTSMDPLAPMTTTLEPAIGHIAQTASSLRDNLRAKTTQTTPQRPGPSLPADDKADTVRWVLDTPRRLEDLMLAGKNEEAEADWLEVKSLIDKWEGVKGVEEIGEKAKAIIGG